MSTASSKSMENSLHTKIPTKSSICRSIRVYIPRPVGPADNFGACIPRVFLTDENLGKYPWRFLFKWQRGVRFLRSSRLFLRDVSLTTTSTGNATSAYFLGMWSIRSVGIVLGVLVRGRVLQGGVDRTFSDG